MLGDQKQTFFTVKDIPAREFIEAFADYLKKNNLIERPNWVDYAKTSTSTSITTQGTNSPLSMRTGYTPESPPSPAKSTSDLTPASDCSPTSTEDSSAEVADPRNTSTLVPRSSDGVSNNWRSSN